MFYLIEITTYEDNTKDAYGVYPQETLDVATASFHQKMAGAIRNENYASELCLLIDGRGAVQRYEYWERGNTEGGEDA